MKPLAPLKKGDIIDLVMPGFPATKAELSGAVKFLRQMGFQPRVPKDFFGKDVISSNTDDARFRHLRKALTAPDSKAVWCLRGGYGSIRLLPKLKTMPKARSPKIFVGLSDITSLHLFLNQKWGWPTFHASLLERLGSGRLQEKYVRELFTALQGETQNLTYSGLKPLNGTAKLARNWKGEITGGNLIVAQSTLATDFEITTRGKFLFLEDIGERGYKIDRVLEHFRQAGKLKGLRGVLFGDFTGGDEPGGGSKVWPVITRFSLELDSLKIPCFSKVPCGHGPVQRPIPFATQAILRGGARGQIEISTGIGG